jgi:hypothetical protein
VQGTYLDTLLNAVGCDSVLTLNLTVKQNSTGTINQSICQGQSYFFNGANRTAQGTYLDTLVNAVGCDSILTLNLTVKQNSTGSFSQSICQGQSYFFNGANRTVQGTYLDTLVNAAGCDSVLTLNLTVNNLPSAAINGPTTICSGLSATLTASGGTGYNWNNSLGSGAIKTVSPTTATTYTVTVTDNNNCTATASQTVSVTTSPTATITGSTTVCAGSSITLTANGGNTYTWANGLGSNAVIIVSQTQTTTYTVTVSIGANCTASTSQTVTVKQPSASTVNQTICSGKTFAFNGQQLTQDGTYSDTILNAAGCDSIITLNLSIAPVLQGSFNQTICFGGSYTFNNQTLTQDGAYKDTVQTSGGCDSIVTLNLSLSAVLQSAFSDSICSGDSYLFNGNNLSQGGQYFDTLQTSSGCDSVVTLNLTVNSLPQPTVTQTNDTLSTQLFVSYKWLRNGAPVVGASLQKLTLSQTGNYSVVVTDANGCSDTSSVLNITSVDVKDILSNVGVKLYPNPNTGTFVIEFTDSEPREIEITDAIGRVVLSTIKIEKEKQISLDEKAAGIYFLNIRQNGQAKSLKFTLIR